MDLVINHRNIITPIKTILETIRYETGNKYFKDIQEKSGNVMCTCPFHKDGQESKPACNIVSDRASEYDVYGTFNCFACKEKGQLPKLVGRCFCEDEEDFVKFGEQWLVERFGNVFVDEVEFLPEIQLETKKLYINEDVLNNFEYDNEDALNYLMNKRHISKDVIDYFKIGFNKTTGSITFPCWNEKNKLVGIFERSIYSKHFHIPEITPKPIYLLNEAVKNNFTTVYVVESQINALTLYSWGIPAIALFGTGSSEQYKILRKSGIRTFILAFDGDEAGRRGREKFIKNMSYDCMISYIDLPEGKDVNDLSYQYFISLPMYNL